MEGGMNRVIATVLFGRRNGTYPVPRDGLHENRPCSLKALFVPQCHPSGMRVGNAWSPCVLVLAFCIAGIPALSQTSAQREIPFENSPNFGLILVKAEANGRPAMLIVDTAASSTILSSDLAYGTPYTLRNMVSTSKGSGFAGRGIIEKATLKIGPLIWRDHG